MTHKLIEESDNLTLYEADDRTGTARWGLEAAIRILEIDLDKSMTELDDNSIEYRLRDALNTVKGVENEFAAAIEGREQRDFKDEE